MTGTTLRDAIALIESGRAEGVSLVRQMASARDPQALFVLADMAWSGTMVPQDPVRGRLLLEQAAALGHVHANLLCTNLLASGVAGNRDWSAAVGRLEVEAAKIPARKSALDLVKAMDLDAKGDPKRTPEPTIIAERPCARLFERLLTPDECAYLVTAASDGFEASMVYNDAGELVRDTIRTSDGATIHWLIEDPAIHALNRRVAAISRTSYDQGEALQVLRYAPGQEYRPHFDWIDSAANQRLWTALIYLNDEYEGGQTAFVRTGQEVRGRTGDVLLFSNAQQDGHGDPLAEHAGMPVTAGTKLLATRWIRESRWIP